MSGTGESEVNSQSALEQRRLDRDSPEDDRAVWRCPWNAERRNIGLAVTRAQRGKDFVEKAVTLLEIIAKEHPFVDGNKRTAFAAAETTLRLSGYYLGVTDEDAIDFILKVARRELTHDKVVRWIKDRLKGDH